MGGLGKGHAFIGGLVAGIVLDKETLIVFGLGLALGVLGVLAWGLLRDMAGWVRNRFQGPPPPPAPYRTEEVERW